MADKKDSMPADVRLDRENAAKDKRNKDEYAAYLEYLKQEKEENEAPRKAVGAAVDKAVKFAKDKVSDFGKATGLYAKGGKVKSASTRGDGIAQRGKTKGRVI